MRGKNFFVFFWGIFAVVGAVILLIGGLFAFPRLLTPGWETATAEVTETKNGRTFFRYEIGGETYESSVRGSATSLTKGVQTQIRYDTEDPTNIRHRGFDCLFLIAPGIGFLFALMGGIGLGVTIHAGTRAKRLRENGRRVRASYVDTIRNTMVRVNGRCPYRVICSWQNPEDGKSYLFRSENLWTNPMPEIERRNIRTFTVFLDPKNHKKYTVDTDGLTENIVDLT